MSAIIVSHLSPTTSKERLRAYFENARHGGGSVSYVLHPLHSDPARAYVAFSHQSVADNVMSVPIHIIDGKEIHVTLSPRQMFGRCSAEVDKKATYVLRSNPELADTLHKDLGVNVIVKNGICVLEGSLIQVETAHEYIADAMRNEEKQMSARLYGNITENGLRRNSERQELHLDHNDLRSLPVMPSSRFSGRSHNPQKEDKIEIKTDREKDKNDDQGSERHELIPAGLLSRKHPGDSRVLGYIQQYRKENLIGIERKYNVRCVISAKGTSGSVTFVAEGRDESKTEGDDNVKNHRLAPAESEFFDLYHTVLDRNVSKIVTFYDILPYNRNQAAEFKPQLEGLFRVLVQVEDEGSILITGRPGNVSQAEEFAQQSISEQRNLIIQGQLLTPTPSQAPSRTLSPMSLMSPTQLPAPASARTATASTALNDPISRGTTGGSKYNNVRMEVRSEDSDKSFFEKTVPRVKPRTRDAGSLPEYNYEKVSPAYYYPERTPSLPSPYAQGSHSPNMSSTPKPKAYVREVTPSVHGEPFHATRPIVPVENYPESWQPYGQPVAVLEYPHSLKIRLFLADIFSFPVDVLVCPKRPEQSSVGPSFMEYEVIKRGGYEFSDEMQKALRDNPLEQVGNAVTVTAGGQLRARYVVLTAGPYLQEDFSNFEQVELQMNETLREIFTQTNFSKARTMALPLIGTGHDNVPVDLFARSLHGVLKERLSAKWTVKDIYIVTLHEEALSTVQTVLMQLQDMEQPKPAKLDPPQVLERKDLVSKNDKDKKTNRAWISHGVGDWTMADDFEWIVKDFTMDKDKDTIVVVEFVVGNIAAQHVDAIVNAANNQLELLGGTSGAILKAGGQQIQDDCRRYVETHGSLEVSQVISTKATGNLKCGHVIHTVGPIWVGDSGMRQCLKNLQDTFYNVLVYANSHFNIATLALPAISTGIYGVPTDVCMCAFYSALQKHVTSRASGGSLTTVRIISLAVDEVETMATLFGELMTSPDGGDTMAAILGASSTHSSKTKSKEPRSTSVTDDAVTSARQGLDVQRQQLQLPRSDNRGRWSSNANEWRADAGQYADEDTPKTSIGSAKVLGREDVGKEPSDYVSLDTVRRMLSPGDKSKCDLCEAPTTSKEERQTLNACGHSLCVTCWQDHCKHYMTCPVCSTVLGIVKGPQPHGSMTQAIDNSVRIPGYSDVMGAIVVTYSVPAGEQEAGHPSPGAPYEGLTIKAFLPNTGEGRTLCGLLQIAFNSGLTFTVGQAESDKGLVVWASVPHKTKLQPVGTDFTRDSYPDSMYIQRTAAILQQLGVGFSSAASGRLQDD